MKSEKINQRAGALLEIIVAELKKRGREAASGRDNKGRHEWFVICNGTKVPLRFESERRTYGAGYHFSDTGKIKLRIDWVWIEYDIKLKAKTFKESDKREHGLDIAKVCNHIEMWAEVYEREHGKVVAQDQSKEQWSQILTMLQAQFPEAVKKVHIEATSKGLGIRGTFGQRDAEAILKVLS